MRPLQIWHPGITESHGTHDPESETVYPDSQKRHSRETSEHMAQFVISSTKRIDLRAFSFVKASSADILWSSENKQDN